jgi:hypothetical protein
MTNEAARNDPSYGFTPLNEDARFQEIFVEEMVFPQKGASAH